jgi:hypothetical protein
MTIGKWEMGLLPSGQEAKKIGICHKLAGLSELGFWISFAF